jgi:hypothetical protein
VTKRGQAVRKDTGIAAVLVGIDIATINNVMDSRIIIKISVRFKGGC